MDQKKHQDASEVLKSWLEIENANLNRIRLGIHRFVMPNRYQTNSTQIRGEGGQSRVSLHDLEKAAESIKEPLNYLAYYLHRFGKIPSGACCAMLLRRIGGDIFDNFGIGVTPILTKINQLMQIQGERGEYFAGVDALNELIDKKLEQPKDISQQNAASV